LFNKVVGCGAFLKKHHPRKNLIKQDFFSCDKIFTEVRISDIIITEPATTNRMRYYNETGIC